MLLLFFLAFLHNLWMIDGRKKIEESERIPDSHDDECS
jgi:hypothetical protein